MLTRDTPCWGCTVPGDAKSPNGCTHSLESKLISDSDLLYLNKSHVPTTTQTGKIIFTAVICVAAFLYPSKIL